MFQEKLFSKRTAADRLRGCETNLLPEPELLICQLPGRALEISLDARGKYWTGNSG